jgi:O-methyltransferase involved in polyketide biosynthesis
VPGSDLAASLRAAGFEALERTVVVWEGVTNYLTGEAVDATIRGLAALAGSDSRLIFTYVDRDLTLFLDLSAREAADRYLLPLGRHDPASSFYRIAAAEIR